tara:strand:- start:220 stop:561 length:342 start_codon:yes stop_codon:yes gene_type:complete
MYSRNPLEGSDTSSTCTVPDFFAENEACLPCLILNVFTAFVSSLSSLKVTRVVVIVKEEDVDVSPLLFRSIVATASSSSSLSKDDEDDTVEKNRIDFLFVEVLFRRTRKEHDA